MEVESQDKEKLRQENMQLANMLGQAQQKITHLEETVKMLEAPKEEKKQNGGGFFAGRNGVVERKEWCG